MSLLIGTTLDCYTIDSVLGNGGFGVTYKALDRNTGGYVAIKENFPIHLVRRDSAGHVIVTGSQSEYDRLKKRFIQEARILANSSHEGLVKVYKAFEAYGTAYFAMEFLDGAALTAYKEPNFRWSEPELRALLTQLLGTLTYIHGKGIYHRDIKPANIIIRRDTGKPVLIDFGSAKLESAMDSLTAGFVSYGYSAPEQLNAAHGSLGPWTDVYALGATVYSLLKGQAPPHAAIRMGGNEAECSLSADSALKVRFGSGFLRTIDRSLKLDTADRYRSAKAWLKDPDYACDEADAPVYPYDLSQPIEKPSIWARALRLLNDDRNKPDKDSSRAARMPYAYENDKDGYRLDVILISSANWCILLGGALLLILFLTLLGAPTQHHGLDVLFPFIMGIFLLGLCLRIVCRFCFPPPEEDEDVS